MCAPQIKDIGVRKNILKLDSNYLLDGEELTKFPGRKMKYYLTEEADSE